jgi:putative transposase
MPHHTPELNAQEVLRHTQELLAEKLTLNAEGYKCTTDDLFKVLLGVAATKSTVEAVCADLVGTPDPQTVRGYFNAQLCVEELPQLEQQLNAALAAEVPRRVRRHAQEVAIDYHDRPYYGKGEQAHELWVRGKAKDGTTRFYRVATAYLILNGLRVTLAIHFVLPDDDTVGVVDGLLHRVHRQGIRISCLLLDKGFESMAMMAYLTRQGQAALIACPIRGTTGGTRALCQGRKSYATTYTFKDKQGQTFTAPVLVCRVFTTARRTGRLRRQAEWLLFIALGLTLSPRYARHLYGQRFGIETSYRCEGQVRGWTTAKNPAYRFVLLALAFVLLNVWILLRWRFTQVPRRGGRWFDTPRFPLRRFVTFLQHALEAWYGCVQAITAPALPLEGRI